jgi:hypothetical protein
MATVANTANLVVCAEPFLVRRLICTSGLTGLAVTHGEATAPDIIIPCNTYTNPTASEICVTRTSATVVTVDCENDAAHAFDVYLIWVSQSSGGIS